MSVSISFPSVSWATQDVTLDGVRYTFEHTYNSRNKRSYLNIFQNEVEVISGLKIVESAPIAVRSSIAALNGQLFCLRFKSTDEECTLGNIGFNKEYELIYFTSEELDS